MDLYYPTEKPAPLALPLVNFKIPAGFPSPAADYVETRIDLNKYLVKNPSFTFYARVEGDSMVPLMQDGDLALIDKKAGQPNGCIVLASVNNKYCFKQLYRFPDGSIELRPENAEHESIHLPSEFEGEFEIFGRVLYTIRDLAK